MELNRTLGYYFPSFFRMNIGTGLLEDINRNNRATLNVYFHEYIHFYQDIATIYGLQNISHTIDVIAAMNINIAKSILLDIPVTISSEDITGTNIALENLYIGHTNDLELSPSWQISNINVVKNGLIANFEDIPQIKIIFQDGRSSGAFDLGSYCILESMACEIDRYIFNDYSHPEFPYNVCRKIFDNSFPPLVLTAESKAILIAAICELSLNSFHPAEHFLRILKIIADQHLFDIKQLYQFVDTLQVNWKSQWINNIDLLPEFSSIAISQLRMVINNSTHADLVSWSEELIESARVLRAKVNFICELSKAKSYEDKISCFTKTINYLGTPIIIDRMGNVGFQNPHFDCGSKAFYLIGIQSIHNLLRKGIVPCELRQNCRLTIPSLYNNDICQRKPWVQAQNEQLCPYAQVWKTWGYYGKTPNI